MRDRLLGRPVAERDVETSRQQTAAARAQLAEAQARLLRDEEIEQELALRREQQIASGRA